MIAGDMMKRLLQRDQTVGGDVTRSWFDDYLRRFAACARNDTDDLDGLLDYYAVPLVVTSDAVAVALTSADDVMTFVRQQIDGLREVDYDHTTTLRGDVVALNGTSALYAGEFSRHRGDGGEIGRLQVTYLITNGPSGRRISAMALHSG